ncbi:MAG TPA: phosphoadenylyl-sulfate reductase [Burkholderiales bacterium]|jgi:phosphoadenosine phosphosulfate reductase|nr:phosphoadenylyl-sulfate reductase [Burkholderiales bacterium]
MAANPSITTFQTLATKVQALEALLARIAHEYAPATLASSLSIEDMVLTDAILRNRIAVGIFTLDTGRMHQDTLDVIGAIEKRYGSKIEVYQPQAQAVTQYVKVYGRDAFYESVDLRKECCEIRKVEPLKRALAGKKAWITGMRRSQSTTRDELPVQGHDDTHDLEKFSPLADWSEEDVWAYIRAYEVPYNRLYDQGYRSIGCAPCTRPTVAGEDVRAGRWWWEQPESKECGLHVGPDGRLVRSKGNA